MILQQPASSIVLLVKNGSKQAVGTLISQFRLISLWMLICFAQVGVFAMSFDNFAFSPLLNPANLMIICVFFLFFTELAWIITNISVLGIWACAKFLNGQGNYLQTYNAFLWALIYLTIPYGFCFVLLQFDLPYAFVIRKIFRLGMFASLIFGVFFVLLRNLANVQKFSFLRSFFTIFLSGVLLLPLVLFAIYVNNINGDFSSNFRTLFITIMPTSIILAATLAFIAITSKTIKVN